jgi:putative ABC transport system permease protein
MFYVARTTGDPLALVGSARTTLQSLDPMLPLTEVRPAKDLIGESLGRHRLTLLLLAAFSGGALLLAAMGIYGVVASGVIRRTPEIGIRLALGASGSGVLRLVATEGARVVFSGLVLGLIGALAASRILHSLLFGVRPDDPLTYAAVVAFLALSATIACLVPASRAVRISPTRALRGE